jgi:hypothetical protein
MGVVSIGSAFCSDRRNDVCDFHDIFVFLSEREIIDGHSGESEALSLAGQH